jgi:PPP family 3-phenylpropionic acid transporter
MRELPTAIRGIIEDFLGCAEAYPVRGLFFFTYAGICIAGNFFFVALRQEGFSGKEIGLLGSMAPLIGVLVQPIWGVVADRFDHSRCLRLATLVTAAIVVRMYWVRGFWPFFYITALLALFRAPLQPLMDAVALDFVEARGKLSYGMFLIWASIASGVGTAGTGWLIEGRATRTAFLWGAGMMLAGILCGALGKRATPKHSIEKTTFKGLGSVVRNVPLMAFLLIVFFVFFCSTAFWNFNGVYYTDLGGSSILFGLAVAMASTGEIPFFFLAAPIFKRVGLHRTLLFTFAFSTLRLFAYAFISNPRVAVWLELSNGISWTLFWVGAVEYIKQIVKPEWRATVQSLLYACSFGAGTILGVVWNGFVLDYSRRHFQNPWVTLPVQKLFLASGLLFAAVTLVSVVYFKNVRQQPLAAAGAVPGATGEIA